MNHCITGNINRTIIIVVFILLFIFLLIMYTDYRSIEAFDERKAIKWIRTPNCKMQLGKTILEVMKENNLIETDIENRASIYFSCGCNVADNEIDYLPHVYRNNGYKDQVKDESYVPRKVFIIDGMDNFVAKNLLWKHLVEYYGADKAKIMAPTSYLLHPHNIRDEQIKQLKHEHNDGDIYILKKNIQRQDGLEITKNINDIVNADSSCVIAQKLLCDSYLVNNRKINLRVYILVTCYRDNTNVYVFDDGFVYYSKIEFEPNNESPDNHITSGYIDRDVYIRNPLTHHDFRKYLNLPEGRKYHATSDHARMLSGYEKKLMKHGHLLSEIVFARIHKLIKNIFVALKGKICRSINSRNNKPVPIYKDYSASIFGADVAINKNLHPQIIEINKGPDIDIKDKRDGMVKKRFVRDSFRIMGLIPDDKTPNGLVKILEM